MKTILLFLCALTIAGCAVGHLRTDDGFGLVQYGMTQQDTLRVLGKPDETEKFAATQTEAWDYQYQDAWGYLAILSVIFGPDGRVVGKFSRRLNDGGDHGTG